MPATMFYDQDADLGLLKGKTIAIIGYGSQGHAQDAEPERLGLQRRGGTPSNPGRGFPGSVGPGGPPRPPIDRHARARCGAANVAPTLGGGAPAARRRPTGVGRGSRRPMTTGIETRGAGDLPGPDPVVVTEAVPVPSAAPIDDAVGSRPRPPRRPVRRPARHAGGRHHRGRSPPCRGRTC